VSISGPDVAHSELHPRNIWTAINECFWSFLQICITNEQEEGRKSRVQISGYTRTRRKEWKGVSKRHSLCFLLRGLPFPAFSLFTLTSANPQVQYLVSISKETSLRTPSLSEDESLASASLTYFTYIARSLNRSRSSGIRTTLSTPGEDTWCKRL